MNLTRKFLHFQRASQRNTNTRVMKKNLYFVLCCVKKAVLFFCQFKQLQTSDTSFLYTLCERYHAPRTRFFPSCTIDFALSSVLFQKTSLPRLSFGKREASFLRFGSCARVRIAKSIFFRETNRDLFSDVSEHAMKSLRRDLDRASKLLSRITEAE